MVNARKAKSRKNDPSILLERECCEGEPNPRGKWSKTYITNHHLSKVPPVFSI